MGIRRTRRGRSGKDGSRDDPRDGSLDGSGRDDPRDDPRDGAARKAERLCETGRFEGALEICERELKSGVRLPWVFTVKGRSLVGLGRAGDALRAADLGLEEHPGNPGLQEVRAASLLSMGKNKQAASSINESITPGQAGPGSLNTKAGALIGLKKYREAVECAEDGLRRAASGGGSRAAVSALHNTRAMALERMGRHEEALQGYAQSAEADPTTADPLIKASRLAGSIGMLSESYEICRKALRIAPRDHGARVMMAALTAQMGDPEGAIRACESVLAEDPGNRNARVAKARVEKLMRNPGYLAEVARIKREAAGLG